jgi:hypothetical protein
VSDIVEVMARAICDRVGPCSFDRTCAEVGASCREQRITEARAAIAALDAAGFAIVPKEPTEAMVIAGNGTLETVQADDVYRAMLAAAKGEGA